MGKTRPLSCVYEGRDGIRGKMPILQFLWKYKIGAIVGVTYSLSYWITYFGEEFLETIFGEDVISFIFPIYRPLMLVTRQIVLLIYGYGEGLFYIPIEIFVIDLVLFVFLGSLVEFLIRRLYSRR